MGFDPVVMAEILVTALLSALVGLAALSVLRIRRPPSVSGVFAEAAGSAAFMFDHEALVDATPGARALLAHSPIRNGSVWTRLMAFLGPRFPDLPVRLAHLPTDGQFTLASADGTGPPLLLLAELRGGLTRISLTDPDADHPASARDALSERATQDELDGLRATVAAAPLPVWRETAAGEVIWANGAYLDLAARRLEPGRDLAWPLPRLFDRTAVAQGAERQRQRLDQPDGAPTLWFDLASAPDGEGRVLFGLPADAAVQAEGALRGFMQTLAKTFAHLPTGLAIFDQNRQLALFNPALIDLTALPPDLLSGRPTLAAFFDAMRERAMLPEPRDYRNWRRQMSELEAAAANGLYEETWSLPGGQTYRVTGRPHPNGALALMFDDISTEMSQTRRYRADLELGQSVIDAMEEAIAVFTASGMLVISNAAYAALWGHDPAGTLDGEAGIAAVCEHWRRRCAVTGVWDRVEDFAVAFGPRVGWSDEVRMTDGRPVACRFERLAGGATLAGFRVMSAAEAAAPLFSSMRRIA